MMNTPYVCEMSCHKWMFVASSLGWWLATSLLLWLTWNSVIVGLFTTKRLQFFQSALVIATFGMLSLHRLPMKTPCHLGFPPPEFSERMPLDSGGIANMEKQGHAPCHREHAPLPSQTETQTHQAHHPVK